MARERDDYDVQALKAEMDALKAERQQERAELAMLRAELGRHEKAAVETAESKAARERFNEWVALSAEEKTQLAADSRYKDRPELGDWWEVQLVEHPKVRVRAHSDYEAVGRYNDTCGITGTSHKHVVSRLDPQPTV